MTDLTYQPGNDAEAIESVVNQINDLGGIGGSGGLSEITGSEGITVQYTGEKTRGIKSTLWVQRAIKSSVTLDDAAPTATVEIPDGNGHSLIFNKTPGELKATIQIKRTSGSGSGSFAAITFYADGTTESKSWSNYNLSGGKYVSNSEALMKGGTAGAAMTFCKIMWNYGSEITCVAVGSGATSMTIVTVFRLMIDA